MNETQLKASDEIRHQIVEAFNKFEPQIHAYSEYAKQIAALGLEYKLIKLGEEFPDCLIEERTRVLEFELHSTPATLDHRIEELKAANALPKRVIVDRVNQKITIFV